MSTTKTPPPKTRHSGKRTPVAEDSQGDQPRNRTTNVLLLAILGVGLVILLMIGGAGLLGVGYFALKANANVVAAQKAEQERHELNERMQEDLRKKIDDGINWRKNKN